MTADDGDLDRRRTVVVSGGSSGIGLAAASRFVADGDSVLLVARNGHRLALAAEELGHDVRWLAADLGTAAGATSLRDAVDGHTVDVVVAAAGSAVARERTDLRDIESDWLTDFRANVLTAVLMVEAVRDHIPPDGRVVCVGSVAGQLGSGYGGSYGAAKAALQAWVFTLARELGPRGVTVNAVLPGYIPDTSFFGDRRTADLDRVRAEMSLLGRVGYTDEVAATIHFLASPGGSFITGQLVGVNGGMVLGR